MDYLFIMLNPFYLMIVYYRILILLMDHGMVIIVEVPNFIFIIVMKTNNRCLLFQF